MNSYLLYPGESLAGKAAYPSFQDIYKDLNLNIIIRTMSQNDVFLMEQIRSVMMIPVCDPSVIQYRYEIIKNFYDNPELLEKLYQLARQGGKLADQYRRELEQNRSRSSARAGAIISALHFTSESLALLKEIKLAVADKREDLHAEGLLAFDRRFSGYPLKEFEAFHNRLLFYTSGGEGVFSVRISGGLKLASSCMCNCRSYHAATIGNNTRKLLKAYYKFMKKDTILIEDEELAKDIDTFIELHMHKIIDFYKPLLDDLLFFWRDFGKEIGFYRGVNHLQCRMKDLSLPFCYAECREDRSRREIEELYELSMGLYVQVCPVPNTFTSDGVHLTIITGANQGGKSTFLRSFGIAQVLMQCGMPVPARRFSSGLYSRIHTHFTRKEDSMLSRGRLEEELKRMSSIIDSLAKDSLVLLNESFASTTEKEGSQIAQHVIMPLYQKGIEVMMVTHLHEFAKELYDKKLDGTEFLVAERQEDGKRTFHIIPGVPHYSSYGTDLYSYMIGDLTE